MILIKAWENESICFIRQSPFHKMIYSSGIGEFGGEGRLEGYIDELYIYNKTLTEPELKLLINKCHGPQSTMVLHLSFDKKRGPKFLDDSGLMNHASMGGPPPLPGQPTPAPPPRKWLSNRFLEVDNTFSSNRSKCFPKRSSNLTWSPRLSTRKRDGNWTSAGMPWESRYFSKLHVFPRSVLALENLWKWDEIWPPFLLSTLTLFCHFIFRTFSLQTNPFIHFCLLIFPRLVLFVIQSSFSTFFIMCILSKLPKEAVEMAYRSALGKQTLNSTVKLFETNQSTPLP